MDYYESAEDYPITYKQALSELAKHGITDAESIEAFDTECWKENYRFEKHGRRAVRWDPRLGGPATIYAHLVLDWLGY